MCRKPLQGEDAIGLAVGQVIGDHKMKKHFDLTITEKCFSYARRTDNFTAEAGLDGLYVIRTCVSSERMNSDHVVLTYKSLAKVERSKSAKQKDATRRTPEDLPVQSFRDLLKCMATLTRNSIRFESSAPEFHQLTESTPLQRRALELLSAHA